MSPKYTVGGKGGKKVILQESHDRIIVRTKNARKLKDSIALADSKKIIKKFKVEREIPGADVTILKSKVDVKKNTLRDEARTALKKEKELRFAGRVLVDEKSQAPVIYTENLFIKFHDDVSADTCQAILDENHLVIKKKIEVAKNSYFVKAPENIGQEVFDLSEKLLERAEVELCQPEVLREKGLKTIHTKQWHLKNTKINGTQVNANVKADLAHGLAQGEDITIAIIDDGFDIDHPEFKMPGKVVHSRDSTEENNNPRPTRKDENHGTCCAGVAAASGVKASGVAPKANLMPIRNTSDLGSITEAEAIKWAVDHGADIISCSWGPPDGVWYEPDDPTHTTASELPDFTRLAIDDAVRRGRNGKGCVVFFAAGNGNEDVCFDGYISYKNVIAISASNDTNKRSIYSDYGDAVWCCFPSNDWGDTEWNHPEPLSNGIYTTDRLGAKGDGRHNYVDDFGGTSSACPGAAGVAALMLSANRDLTWIQVRDILKETSEKIDPQGGFYDEKGHSKYYGYGKIDAYKAVRRAIELRPNTAGIKIISALVNPLGKETRKEKLKLKNSSAADINLKGWTIEVKGQTQKLTQILAAGQTLTISLGKKVKLANTGSAIRLLDQQKEMKDLVAYISEQVKEGAEIVF